MESAFIGNRQLNVQVMRDSWVWFLALGILLIILGVMALGVPIAVSVTMTIFLGIILLVGGVAQFVHAVTAHKWSGFFMHLLGSAVYIIFGIALLINPDRGVRALTLLLAIYFLASGFVKILMSLVSWGQYCWGWLFFSGIVSFILGALIWSQWPDNSDWIIGLLVGIDLFLSGWSMVMIAIAARSAPPPAAA